MPDPSAYGVPPVAVAVWLSLLREFAVVVVILTLILLVVLYPMIFGLRRIMAAIRVLIGPNRTGYQGLLQTPTDALKVLAREDDFPAAADKWPFILAPIIVFEMMWIRNTLPRAGSEEAQ